MSSLQLDPDRALPFPAEQRNIAREIYGETKDLPLICMHGMWSRRRLPTTSRSLIQRSCSSFPRQTLGNLAYVLRWLLQHPGTNQTSPLNQSVSSLDIRK